MKIITVRIPPVLYAQLAVVALREHKTVESVARAMFSVGSRAIKASMSHDLFVRERDKEDREVIVFEEPQVLRVEAFGRMELSSVKVKPAASSMVFVEPTASALQTLALGKSDVILSVVRKIVQLALWVDEYRDRAPEGLYVICSSGSEVRLTLF